MPTGLYIAPARLVAANGSGPGVVSIAGLSGALSLNVGTGLTLVESNGNTITIGLALTSGLTIKASVIAATTSSEDIAFDSYADGVITLSSALTSLDGVTIATHDRLLLKDFIEGDSNYNGIYTYTDSTHLTRSSDANTSILIPNGTYTFVSTGTLNAGIGYVLVTPNPIILDSSLLEFTEFVSSRGISTLDGDTDVNLISPTNGQVLTYDASDSRWTNITPTPPSGTLLSTNNLDDLDDIAVALSNLGIGTAGLESSSAFDAAGAASTAQSTAEAFATSAITALGLGTASTKATSYFDVAGSASTAQSNAETFATSAITALGLGTASTKATGYFDVAGSATTAQSNAEANAASLYVPLTDMGNALGVATLDGTGHVPTSQLPSAVVGDLQYAGTWNASINSPTLTSSVGTQGTYYVVSTTGTTTLNGISNWAVGDWAIFSGSVWEHLSGSVDSLIASNNLSDLTSASTSRTNLGLGSAATQASSAFDTAGAAATAQSTAESFTTAAITALGLGTASTHSATDFDASGAAATAQSTAETFATTAASARMRYQGTWSSLTAYVLNDVVIESGSTYVCIDANTNEAVTNATYWTALGGSGGGGSSTLAGDSDVLLSSPATGQVLTYNGSEWVNNTPTVYDTAGAAAAAQTAAESFATSAITALGLGTASTHATSYFDLAGAAATALSTAESNAATLYVPLSEVGANSGVASLNSSGIVPNSQLPTLTAGNIDGGESIRSTTSPKITSYYPTGAAVGDTVTLTGVGFTTVSAVNVNSTSASFTVVSDTSITLTVPAGATAGPIAVYTPSNGDFYSTTNFLVVVYGLPTITSYSQSYGAIGTIITITGTNFFGTTSVEFNSTTASYTIVNTTTITATVPSGATTGTITAINPAGTGIGASFTVSLALTVTTSSDSGAGSLRAAITSANGSPGSVITFSGVTGTITLASALPSITVPMTITGPGATTLAISGNSLYQPFSLNISGSGTATITGLTIENGFESSFPGGAMIINGGYVVVSNCAIINNDAYYAGAISIQSAGNLTLTSCTLSGNNGSGGFNGAGGAISCNGTLIMTNCTLYNNTGNYSIFVLSGFTTITNCTISDNSIGGLTLSGTNTITNCIIYGDSGEISYSSGTLNVTYSCVQGGFSGVGNISGNPLLGTFQNNGGTTNTMALGGGSPALGAGTATGAPVNDQRGTARPNPPSMGAWDT